MERTTQAANAVVATAITIGGVATGLSYAVLLAGFAGGLVSLSFIPALGLWQRIWTPVAATLTAGYTAPVLVPMIGKLTGVEAEGAPGMLFAAWLIGLMTQVGLPAAMRRLHTRIEGPEVKP